MFTPGWTEILVIGVIFIVLFGGSKSKEMIKKMGKDVSKFKNEFDDIKNITNKKLK